MSNLSTVVLLARQQDLLRELLEIGRELTRREVQPVVDRLDEQIAKLSEPVVEVTEIVPPAPDVPEDPYCKKPAGG